MIPFRLVAEGDEFFFCIATTSFRLSKTLAAVARPCEFWAPQRLVLSAGGRSAATQWMVVVSDQICDRAAGFYRDDEFLLPVSSEAVGHVVPPDCSMWLSK